MYTSLRSSADGYGRKVHEKRSSEKALDGMQQCATKFEQRGEKYGIAVSGENLCSLIPIHHRMVHWGT